MGLCFEDSHNPIGSRVKFCSQSGDSPPAGNYARRGAIQAKQVMITKFGLNFQKIYSIWVISDVNDDMVLKKFVYLHFVDSDPTSTKKDEEEDDTINKFHNTQTPSRFISFPTFILLEEISPQQLYPQRILTNFLLCC